jgi:hypothetical protein
MKKLKMALEKETSPKNILRENLEDNELEQRES